MDAFSFPPDGNYDAHQPLLQSSHGKHGSGAELEGILSDTGLPFWHRLRAALRIELKLLFHLAGPTVVVCVIGYFLAMCSMIFSGHLGNLEYAAAALGNNGVQTFAYGLLVCNRYIRSLNQL